MNQLFTMTVIYVVGDSRYETVIKDITVREMRDYQDVLRVNTEFVQFRSEFFNKRYIVRVRFQEQPSNPLAKLEG